jgi:MFS transporter, DHA1 family, multidrug resistance protein
VGMTVIGLTLTTFALARLILNVPLGVISDRYGRRVLLIGGPLVTAVGMIGSGFALDIVQLLAWRFVAGAGSAMYMTGAQVYIADISTPANRARFLGTNQAALLLGVSIGPGIGGLIAEVAGLRAPFYVVGVAALVAMFYAWARLPETRHLVLASAEEAEATDSAEAAGGGLSAREEPAPRRAWVRLVRSRDFVAVSWVTMAIFFTRTATRQTLLPLLAVARLGMSAGALGGLFTAMSLINMLMIAPAAMIADRMGRKWAIVPSGLLVAVSLVMMANAMGYAFFLLSALVMAIATGVAGPAPAAYVADIAPPQARGLAMGLYRSAGDFGFVVGPPLLGALADATSFGWGLGANAILIGAASLFFLSARETVTRERKPRVGAEG